LHFLPKKAVDWIDFVFRPKIVTLILFLVLTVSVLTYPLVKSNDQSVKYSLTFYGLGKPVTTAKEPTGI
jgi:hypothetical protein